MLGQSENLPAEVSPCSCVRWVIAKQPFGSNPPHFSEQLLLTRSIRRVNQQSFSKNAGLYAERVGALHVVCPTSDSAFRVCSKLSSIIRTQMSTTPAHGARLVSKVDARCLMCGVLIAEICDRSR